MEHIDINGTTYPFKAAYSVLRKAMRLNEQMNGTEIDLMHLMCVESINKGYKLEGKLDTMTAELLDDLIDQDPKALNRMSEMVEKQQKTEGGSAEVGGK